MNRVLHVLCVLSVLGAWSAFANEPLPQFAKARMGSDRFGAKASAWAFGAGEVGASVSENGYVRLWDIATKRMRWEAHPITQTLKGVAFAGEAAVVAVAEDGQTVVLNAADGHEARRFKLELCTKPCTLIGVQATDKLLMTQAKSVDYEIQESTLRFWSLADGKLLHSHVLTNTGVAVLSPTSDRVAWAVSSADGIPASVTLASIADLSRPTALSCPIISDNYDTSARLAFSPDSKTLTAASVSSSTTAAGVTVCFWATDKPATAARTVDIPLEESFYPLMRSVIFSQDSKWISVVFEEGNYGRDEFYVERTTHQFIEVATGKLAQAYDDGSPKDLPWATHPSAAPLSGGESWIKNIPVYASQDYSTGGYKLDIGDKMGSSTSFPPAWMLGQHHTSPIGQIAVNADASAVVSSDYTGRTLVWRANQANAATALDTHGQIAFAPDGALYNTNPAELEVMNDECSGQVRMGDFGRWDLTTQTYKTLRRGPKLMTRTVHWLPDGQILTCREEHTADATECGYPQGPINATFETSKADGSAPTPLKAAFTYCPPPQGVSPASMRAFTITSPYSTPGAAPDLYNTENAPGEIRDLTTGAVLLEAKDAFLFPTLSPDGKRYAAFTMPKEGDKTHSIPAPDVPSKLAIYDVDTKAVLATLDIAAPANWPTKSPLLFSPDSARLVVAESDNIRVIDLASKSITKTLSGHTAKVYTLAFSGDGKTLVSAQADGLIYTWDWAAIVAAP